MFQTFSFANWGERKIWMWEKYDFNRFDKCERPRETKKRAASGKKICCTKSNGVWIVVDGDVYRWIFEKRPFAIGN